MKVREKKVKFDELVKGRCYVDKFDNVYMFNGYVSPTEVEMVVMEYDKEDDCYLSTDTSVFMDRFDVSQL